MTNETLTKLQQMSPEQKENRFRQLQDRHNIGPSQATLPDGGPPIEVPIEEVEERDWLKNDLGYN